MSIPNMHQSKISFDQINLIREFHRIVDDLVDICKSVAPSYETWRKKNQWADSDIARVKYLRTNRTFGVIGAEGCGKTSWCLTKSDNDTLIVVTNSNIRDELNIALDLAVLTAPGPTPVISTVRDILSASATLEELPHVKKFNKIYVDDASFVLDDRSRNRFYKAILPLCTEDVIFVMLG